MQSNSRSLCEIIRRQSKPKSLQSDFLYYLSLFSLVKLHKWTMKVKELIDDILKPVINLVISLGSLPLQLTFS